MTSDSQGNSDQVLLVTGGYDHTIKLWQAHTGVCQRTAQHTDSQVNALDITPDKQLIAAAGYQHIRMYDLSSSNPNPVINYEGVSKNVTGVGFQEEGKWMYTGGEDCSARIWDLRSRNLQCQRIFQVSAPVNCVCLHPNQAELVVGDQSGVIHLWDLKTDHNEQLIPEAEASIQDIAMDPEGSYMAAVNNRGHCYIWSLTGGVAEEPTKLNPKHKIEAHQRYALKCKFSPDSTLLVTTSADQTARIWKTSDFTLLQELKHEAQRWVWDAAFSADSQYILTGDDTDSGMESMSSSNKSLATTGNTESKDLATEKAGKSEVEDDDIDDEDLDETLSERLWGLTEMFPEGVRNVTYIVLSGTSTGVKGLYGLSRVMTWYFFSSSVILFAPLIFEVERAQMEEMQRSQQKQVLLGPNSAMSGGMGLMPPVQR